MKRASRCLYTGAMLLAAGSMPVAAQMIPNSVYAELTTMSSYSTDSDRIPYEPLQWSDNWLFNFANAPDATYAPVVSPEFHVTSDVPLTGFWPSPPEHAPGTNVYTFRFLDLLVPGYAPRQLPDGYWLSETASAADRANVHTELPKISLVRKVTPEILTDPETLQTITIELTLQEPMTFGPGTPPVNMFFVGTGNLRVAYGGYDLVTSEFVSQQRVDGWNEWTDGTSAEWNADVSRMEVGRTYVFEAALKSTKSPLLLGSPRFKPRVFADYNHTEWLANVDDATAVQIDHPAAPVTLRVETANALQWSPAWTWPRRDMGMSPVVSPFTSEPPYRVIVPASVRIEPETITVGSRGVVTAFIKIGAPYSTEAIDVTSVTLQGAAVARTTMAGDTLIAKFQTADLQGLVAAPSAALSVRGLLRDGSAFEGIDSVRVQVR